MGSKKIMSDEALYAEYSALYRYALSLTGNKQEAEDITQEAFLKAMSSKAGFEGGSSLFTWLCSIAKNLWLNRLKKQKRISPDEPSPDLSDDSPRFEERLEDKQSALDIMQCLHTLDEPYKEVFLLSIFGDVSFSEIAAVFGRTEGWARVTFHRAKAKITDRMRKDGKL